MIRPCGYLENIWPLSASLYRKERRDALKKADGKLLIRDGQWQHPEIGKTGGWSAMRTSIQKANRIILELIPQWEIATVTLDETSPGEAGLWVKAGPEITAHIPVVTNPRCRLCAGQMNVHVPVGDIVTIDPMMWWSCVNDGSAPQIHMVVTLVKREIGE